MTAPQVIPAPAPAARPASAEAPVRDVIATFRRPSLSRSVRQILTSVAPYALLWVAMAYTLPVSYWLMLPFAVVAAGFLVRCFIIMHDCGHGSYFKSRRANDAWGSIMGVLTFTPYFQWRNQHAIHHASAGDLDRRGVGDVWTLTVEEYRAASRARRLTYRLARNPIVLLLLAPLYVFIIEQRFPARVSGKRGHASVYWTNAAIVGIAVAGSLALGFWEYLTVQLTVMAIAGGAGIWLFYVQHQFEGVYWERTDDWTFPEAAMQGSSFYRLPKVLQWFSGNIGFHHLHHLSPAIPNYRLQDCHKSHTFFQKATTVTLRSSLKALSLRLWDEDQKRMVSFKHFERPARPTSRP